MSSLDLRMLHIYLCLHLKCKGRICMDMHAKKHAKWICIDKCKGMQVAKLGINEPRMNRRELRVHEMWYRQRKYVFWLVINIEWNCVDELVMNTKECSIITADKYGDRVFINCGQTARGVVYKLMMDMKEIWIDLHLFMYDINFNYILMKIITLTQLIIYWE